MYIRKRHNDIFISELSFELFPFYGCVLEKNSKFFIFFFFSNELNSNYIFSYLCICGCVFECVRFYFYFFAIRVENTKNWYEQDISKINQNLIFIVTSRIVEKVFFFYISLNAIVKLINFSLYDDKKYSHKIWTNFKNRKNLCFCII